MVEDYGDLPRWGHSRLQVFNSNGKRTIPASPDPTIPPPLTRASPNLDPMASGSSFFTQPIQLPNSLPQLPSSQPNDNNIILSFQPASLHVRLVTAPTTTTTSVVSLTDTLLPQPAPIVNLPDPIPNPTSLAANQNPIVPKLPPQPIPIRQAIPEPLPDPNPILLQEPFPVPNFFLSYC